MYNICRYVVCLLLALTSIVGAPCQSLAEPSEQRVQCLNRYATSTLSLITAFNGNQISRIAMGETIRLGDLSAAHRSQVANAVKVMYPLSESSWGPEEQWALRVSTFFYITIRSKALGENGKLTIQMESFVKSLDPKERPVVQELNVADPPSLESIMANAPTDPKERASNLGKLSLTLLEPLGQMALTKAPEVPFALSDFVRANEVSIGSLSKQQLDWLTNVYSQLRTRAVETSKSFQFTNSSSCKRVMDGVPEEWLSKQLPEWSTLDDATIQPTLEYFPVIVPPSAGSDGSGCGWIMKSGVY